MGKVLTTASDIVSFGGLPDNFPKCDIRRIRSVETEVFRECIGDVLYERLRENLADYDGSEYEKGLEYSKGDVIIHRGIYRIALEDTTEPPSNKEHWGVAPKFTEECLEDLWCDVLGEFLAYSILIPTVPLLLSQLRNGTIVRLAGKDVVSGSKEDLRIVLDALQYFRDLAWRNLVAYVEKNNTSGCYDGFKHCKPCVRHKKKGGIRIC